MNNIHTLDIDAIAQAVAEAMTPTIVATVQRMVAEQSTPKATKATRKTTKKETPVSKTKSTKARKTTERKPAGTTIEGKTCLVAGNRKRFIADHDWAQDGQSVRQLAEAVLVGGQPLVGNWAIGPNRTRLITGEAPKATKAKKTTATVAQVSTGAEAKPPRRANGTITPKAEWDIRRALEAQGLSAKKVDKKTAKAMDLLNS